MKKQENSELKIGLIGLDTSHVPAFTKLLNERDVEYSIPGARVVAAFPGGSTDFPLSINRVEGFTKEIEENYGVEILDSPSEVAQKCDAILITAVDGRTHRNLFEQIAPLKKPVFIDKPFAVSSEDARAMAALALEYSTPLMSCSSLRYAQPVVDALSEIARDEILSVDATGPMQLQATQNNLFWYGIHSVEMLFAAMGAGCREVYAAPSGDYECLIGTWKDGRIGTVRGDHAAQMKFGLSIHTASASHFIKAYEHPKPGYAGLLERVIPFFRGEDAPIEMNETLEIIRFLEAANQSRETGKPVAL